MRFSWHSLRVVRPPKREALKIHRSCCNRLTTMLLPYLKYQSEPPRTRKPLKTSNPKLQSSHEAVRQLELVDAWLGDSKCGRCQVLNSFSLASRGHPEQTHEDLYRPWGFSKSGVAFRGPEYRGILRSLISVKLHIVEGPSMGFVLTRFAWRNGRFS